MTKSHIKLIMELIFIFILPLGIILASISCEKAMTYDENGNQLTEEKHIEYNNVILNEGTGKWINTYKINQLLDNNKEPFSNNYYSPTSGQSWWTIQTNKVFGYIKYNYALRYNYTTTFELKYTIGHYYYFNVNAQNDASNSTIRWRITGLYTNSTEQGIGHEFYVLNGTNDNEMILYCWGASNNNSSFLINKDTNDSTTAHLNINYMQMIDLTEMYGQGYEPTTTQEVKDLIGNNVYPKGTTELTTIDTTQKTAYAEQDLTIWGKLKNLIIDNLQLTDNIIVDIILSYTIIWFIMFIIWHFFYLFFDGLVHIFIDWGHREKEKVK